MRRITLLCTALSLTLAGTMVSARSAHGQVTVQAENGWTFTFTGNINAFYVFESESEDGETVNPFSLVGVGRDGSQIRTGLLPTFAIFEAAGKQGETDLKVHFGFAPQIQTPGGHDNFGNGTQAGAQIDMRQVFMTVGGKWGQILAGRELGVYQRQNILNDQTLFGTGPTGGNFGNPGGTTLGRIGYGYVYPNFIAQITYSSPADRPTVINIGLFNPSTNNGFDRVIAPRLETEVNYNGENVQAWAGGLLQQQEDTSLSTSENDEVAWGVSGGLKFHNETVNIHGSGYYGKGIGTTLKFNGGRSGEVDPVTDDRSTELRPSYGFIGQLLFTPRDSKVTVGGSYGQSSILAADDEEDAGNDFTLHNRAAVGGIYYQATEALKVVFEGTYSWSDDVEDDLEKNKSFVASAGLMLFF